MNLTSWDVFFDDCKGFRHLKGFKRPFKTIKFKSNYKSEK